MEFPTIDKFAKEVAEKALNEITYEGKTVREWVEIIVNQQPSEDCRNCKKWNECPCGKEGHENGTSIGYSIGECKDYEPCEDCISREDAIRIASINSMPVNECVRLIKNLPPVKPTNEDIKEAYLKGYDYGVKDWFKAKTQPSEDVISREEAKKFLYEEIERLHDDGLYDCFSRIIDDMYNELPSVTPRTNLAETSQDCISRQAVINTIFYKSDNSCDVVLSTDLMDRIKHLPSVTPERPKEDRVENFIKHKIDYLEDLASIETNEGRWREEEKYLYAISVLEEVVEYMNTSGGEENDIR